MGLSSMMGLEALSKPLDSRITDYERDTARLRVYHSPTQKSGRGFFSLVCRDGDHHACHGCDDWCHEICRRALRSLR